MADGRDRRGVVELAKAVATVAAALAALASAFGFAVVALRFQAAVCDVPNAVEAAWRLPADRRYGQLAGMLEVVADGLTMGDVVERIVITAVTLLVAAVLAWLVTAAWALLPGWAPFSFGAVALVLLFAAMSNVSPNLGLDGHWRWTAATAGMLVLLWNAGRAVRFGPSLVAGIVVVAAVAVAAAVVLEVSAKTPPSLDVVAESTQDGMVEGGLVGRDGDFTWLLVTGASPQHLGQDEDACAGRVIEVERVTTAGAIGSR